MKITVNNQEVQIDQDTTLDTFLRNNNYQPQKVLVSINRKVIKLESYQKTILKNNDKLELLAFVGGG